MATSRVPAPNPSRRGAGLRQDQGPPPARLHSPPPNPPSSPHPAAAVKPFLAAPDADALARANTGLAFVPHEFLAALGSAAIYAPAVSLLDRARLESWVRALAQGFGPDGPDRYQRGTKVAALIAPAFPGSPLFKRVVPSPGGASRMRVKAI